MPEKISELANQREAYAYIPLANHADVLRIQRALKERFEDERIEWQSAPTLHITLCYAELISDRAIEQFGDGITNRVVTLRPNNMKPLDYLETPDGRALHIVIERNEDLDLLQDSVYTAFEDEGDGLSEFSNPDNWNPHITLGYFPDDIDLDNLFLEEFPDFSIQSAKVVIGRDDFDPALVLTAPQTEVREMDKMSKFDTRQNISELTGSQPLLYSVAEMAGSYPDVPPAPGVDIQGLIDDLNDTDPMFVTLPIGRAGAVSRNKNRYNHEDVKRIVEQVNVKKLTGGLGHLKPENRSSEFKLPTAQWIGAIEIDGTAWGKVYIPPYAKDTRDYIRMTKRVNGKIATSIYGTPDKTGKALIGELEKIDLADPERAGLPELNVTPVITSEMNTGENPMPDENNQDVVISELRKDRNQAIQELAEIKTELKSAQAQVSVISELADLLDTQDVFKVVSEMKKQLDEWQPLVTGVQALGDKPLEKIQEMQETIDELEQVSLMHSIIDAINTKVKFEGARPVIAEMMGIERDDEDNPTLTRSFADAKAAVEYLDSVLERDSIKEMMQSLVYKATGGRATTSKEYGADWRESFIEQGRAKAAEITGGRS